jgi:ABC-type sugar transport system substrate-binding protein
MAAKITLGYRTAALLAVALATATACSSGSVSTGASSAPASSTATAAAAPQVVYNGPEATLPHTYPTPKVKPGLNCRLGYMNIYAAIASLAEEQKAAAAEAKRLGCSFIALNDQLTLTTQVNDFNQLISQHVSAILTYPIVPSALAPSVKKANAAHIVVVGQNTPVAADQPLPGGYATDILQGFDTTAYDRVKDVATHSPGASFGIIGLAQPVASLQYLDQRTKYWAQKFGLKFVGEVDAQQDNPASASTAASGLLAKYPTVKVIFGYNDNAAVAAATVARASNRSSVLIVGSNGEAEALNGIKAGTIFSTSQQNFDQVGVQMVDAAYDLLTGVKVPKFVVVPVTEVNKSNVGSVTPIG